MDIYNIDKGWPALAGAAALMLGVMTMQTAIAETFPDRPIRLILPFSAGGSTDTIGRIIAQGLSKELGVSVIPENRPGAGGTIGVSYVAHSKNDGYTLLMGTGASVVNAKYFYKGLSYNAETSFAPISTAALAPSVLLVNNSIPAHTLQEFIALGRKPGSNLSFSSTGIGSSQFLYGLVFEELSGIKALHVPYKGGGAAALDLVAGRVSFEIDTSLSALNSLQTGKVRALAVTSAQRIAVLPNVPSITETYKNFPTFGWYGVLAPVGTPEPIIHKVNAAMIKFLKSPETVKSMENLGLSLIPSSPQEFAQRIRDDDKHYGGIAAKYHLKPQ
ncbi:Bug family tripartite tricarboxylate transporter substrate binding protein [Candidimonas nitroreducens]|uniref:MFS transporter n=1 Tax=Candidimonas nitroreducens TaxID=683354 RepID=A0A225MD31_9BURK|nr:tripartite tricarboxylate transporter substrate binding protein [Candidimonas nitroreducens]OWT59078.1 MFS transporter [Candidimonas nitroreducens]